MIERFLADGRKFHVADNCDPASMELCFMHFEQPDERFEHLRNFIDIYWNSRFPEAYMWNQWTEDMQREFCLEQYVTVTGSGASWKTTSAAIYVVSRWFSAPDQTVVILTSTTRDGLRRRIWKEVTRYYKLDPALGHLIPSRDCIQWQKGSDDFGIFGIALDRGEIDKAVGKIIGFHAPNVIVVVDEMPYTSEAIVQACVNLETGCERFQFIGLGNADDRLDPHGQMCEPAAGWDSITPDSVKWRTKRGTCLHLDCWNSPNVKAGRNIYPGMVNQKDIDNTIEFYGDNSPQFWQQRRGFWAPEGVSKTVLSSSMLIKFKAFEKPVWIRDFTEGAVLDPSFEGEDRCVLRFPRCGEIEVDNQPFMVIDLGEYKVLKVDIGTRKDDPEHYQIARQVKDECEQRGIPANMFALDSTGEGGGLASIIAREWSPNIMRIEFGGSASARPVSEINSRKSSDEYYNRVTELWYSVRMLIMNGQVRGMDAATASEFCKRRYSMRGRLIMLETKKEMKARANRSPDFADTAAMAVELFRERKGLMTITGAMSKKANKDFLEFARKMDVANDPDAYLVGSLDDDMASYSDKRSWDT